MALGHIKPTAPEISITLGEDGDMMEQVKTFKYLGSLITDDGKDINQVETCMGKGWGLFWQTSRTLLRKFHLPP